MMAKKTDHKKIINQIKEVEASIGAMKKKIKETQKLVKNKRKTLEKVIHDKELAEAKKSLL